MNENFSHIFDKTDHIDESKLWLYSRGKLHRDEAHEVEKHLVDCEMCSDIVEGFSKFGSEGNFNAATNRASETFFNATGRKRKIIIRRLSMAAGFVLIAASSVFLITQLKQTKTPEFQVAKEISSSSQGEGEIIITEDPLAEEIARFDNIEAKTQEKSPESISKSEIADEITERTPSETVGAVNSQESTQIDALNIEQDSDEVNMAGTSSNGNLRDRENKIEIKSDMLVADEDVLTETETVLAETNEPSPKAEQDASFSGAVMDSEEMTVASRSRSDKTLAVNQNGTQPEAEPFKNGMAAYYNGNYESAIQILQNIPKSSPNYWDARWTIANSYLKRQSITKAKSEYIYIRDSENPYQYAAMEKLLKLE